jgi:hypothetical protein
MEDKYKKITKQSSYSSKIKKKINSNQNNEDQI